jgi:hypothetical protein
MYLKVHQSYRDVVAICDSDLIGKKFEEGKRQLDIKQEVEKNRIAKNAFKRNKAIALASAIASGAQAVLMALANPPGPPTTIPLGIAAGALSALQIGKILATKFEGESGASDVSAPSGGGGSGSGGGTSTGSPNPFKAPPLVKVGEAGNSGGRMAPLKAYVVSTDMTREQDNDAILRRRSSY